MDPGNLQMQIRTLEKSPGRLFFFNLTTGVCAHIYSTYAIGHICITYSLAHMLYISDTQWKIIFNNAALGLVAGAYFASASIKQKYLCDTDFISCGIDSRACRSGGQEVTLSVITVSLWALTFLHSQLSKGRVLKRWLTLDFQICSCVTT